MQLMTGRCGRHALDVCAEILGDAPLHIRPKHCLIVEVEGQVRPQSAFLWHRVDEVVEGRLPCVKDSMSWFAPPIMSTCSLLTGVEDAVTDMCRNPLHASGKVELHTAHVS